MRLVILALTAFVALMLCVANPARGAEATGPFQFGNLIYRLPDAGWSRGGVQPRYLRLNLEENRSTGIFLLRGQAIDENTDLHEWAPKQLNALNDVLNAGQAESGRAKVQQQQVSDSKVRSTGVVVVTQVLNDGAQTPLFRIAIALRARDRGEMLVLEARGGDDVRKHSAILDTFAADLHLVNLGADPLLGQPTPGDLDGVYWGMKMTYGIGGMKSRPAYFIFSKAGRFHRDIPAGASLVDFDFDRFCSESPEKTGNYCVADGKLLLDFADGDHEECDIAPSERPNRFKIKGSNYEPLTAPADDAVFDGAYEYSTYDSFGPGSGMSGGVSAGKSFKLTKDRTFESDHFSSAFGSIKNSAGEATAHFAAADTEKNKRYGSYAIRQGMLVLTDATDGAVAQLNILRTEDASILFIDGKSYLLAK